jgi:hypothetical protein
MGRCSAQAAREGFLMLHPCLTCGGDCTGPPPRGNCTGDPKDRKIQRLQAVIERQRVVIERIRELPRRWHDGRWRTPQMDCGDEIRAILATLDEDHNGR